MSVTATDIVAAFELILGWTPDDALVAFYLHLGLRTRAELGQMVLTTADFPGRIVRSNDVGAAPDGWGERVVAARLRKVRLKAFGPYAEGLLIQGRHGLFVLDPEDASVSAALLRSGEYGEAELALAASLVTPTSEVLVVGTHIGALAVPLAKCCARMDAVEANPATQRLVEANLRLNACTNVILHKLAAGASHGTIRFLLNSENSGGSKRRPVTSREYYSYDDPEEVEVDAAPLDDVCGERSYDLVFVDIEGSEYFALAGMQRILRRANALVLEFLPFHIREVAGVSIDVFIDQIEPHFAWLHVPGRDQLVPAEHIRSELRRMYDAGECSDGIYLLKSPPPAWLSQAGLVMPFAES